MKQVLAIQNHSAQCLPQVCRKVLYEPLLSPVSMNKASNCCLEELDGSKSTVVFSLMTAKSVAGVRVAGGSSLVFIDPSSLRRSTTATAAVAAAAANQEPVTMATTASCLARAFGIVVRQIADLLTMLQDYHALAPALPRTLDISYQESINLQVCICFLKYSLDHFENVFICYCFAS